MPLLKSIAQGISKDLARSIRRLDIFAAGLLIVAGLLLFILVRAIGKITFVGLP